MYKILKKIYQLLHYSFHNRSIKRVKFYIQYLREDISSFDNNLLVGQIGYFGHHLEKALKHHNRGKRGSFKRNKLELLIGEYQKRTNPDIGLVEWGKNLIEIYDNQADMYLSKMKHEMYNTILSTEDITNFIKQRVTHRFFQPIEVPSEIIEEIIQTAMTAPISCNRQTKKIIVVKNDLENLKVGDSNNESIKRKAPILLYVADDNRFYGEKYANALDVGSICSNILLVAKAYGLSGCWMYQCESYDQNKLRKELGLEKYYYIYSLIALGYPLDDQEKPPRINIDNYLYIK